MTPRSAYWIVLILLTSTACVMKGKYDETLAEQVQCAANLEATQKDRDELRSKLEDAGKRASEAETRNEELSNTNQLLVGKNTNCAQLSISAQQELLRLKQEKAKAEEKIEMVSRTYDDLVKTLKDEIAEGEVLIARRGDRLSVNVADQVLFPSGSDEIQAKGKSVLRKVVGVLKKTADKRFEIEGHTDNVPISGALKKRFASNWELSTARATKVVRFLEEAGVDPSRLAAVGYGQHHPVSPNNSPEGRRKNRRIEIVLLPQLAPSRTP